MIRERIAALILKDKKILLVKDIHASHYYPPGGSLDEDESHEQALKRELTEKLSISLEQMNFYFSFELINKILKMPQIDHCYLISFSGSPTPSSEVCDLKWVTKEEIVNKKIETPDAFFEKLVPRLVKDGLL